MKKILGVAFFMATLILLSSQIQLPAHAQTSTTFSVESIGGQLGLGSADLKQTILNIVQWVLGILALVAVAMIISSIIIAATSSERAEAAKKTITGAVIGLIIVLLAWAIVTFVLKTTSNITVNT